MMLNGIPTAQLEEQINMFHRLIKKYEVKTFIELGTFMGGLTYEMILKYPEMRVYSFGNDRSELHPLVRNKSQIHIRDIFQQDTINFISDIIRISEGTLLLFCDNGNKIREFDLCHIEDAREVLNVGCGIGVGSTYIAKKHGSRVVGVDISEKMVKWSRQPAREARVEDKVEFRIANVLDLPFEDNRFDVVFAESVLIVLEDKARAIRECVRVTKPGGYVGLNEGFWTEQPPAELVALARDAVGPCVPTLAAWQALWEACGLQERVVQPRQIDAGAEVKGRIRWIGWRWLLRAPSRAAMRVRSGTGILMSAATGPSPCPCTP